MSGALDVLQMKEEDVLKFLAAETHLGGTNLDFQMEQYIYKRKSDGICIINLKRTWEKLRLAARAIVAIENPADVSVISRNTSQLLVVTDPRADHQPLTEASYVNLPTIALCNTDSPLCYEAHSVGLMWWMLAREVLCMCGTVSREHPSEVMPDLYLYRDPEEIEKEEQVAAEKVVTKEEFQGEWMTPAPEFTIQELLLRLLSLKLQTGLKACRCPLCLFSSFLLKTGALSQPLKISLQLPLLRPLNG
ncbi:unnamed protein product [Nyctereutes procyonoides]|uniref:(raccoon dog) hypothetical protein n=1 Tax=Nyctereutes procyonoides TaxID=34880 RepID=A0A811XZ55_NYCPR|nr:unnamed protein product [Nyctereutes procyonoides]